MSQLHSHEFPPRAFIPNQPEQWPTRGRPVLGFIVGLTLSMLVLGLAALALGFGWLTIHWQAQGRILPGVQVLGVPLGGYNSSEASTALSNHWQSFNVALSHNGTTVWANPEDLGMLLDASASAAAAAEVSQQTDPQFLFEFYSSGAHVNPVWELDVQQAEAYLQEINDQVGIPAVDAGVQFTNGQLYATPAVAGEAIDVAATLTWLQNNAGIVVADGRLPLVMRPVQPAIASTEPFVVQANGRLNRELSLQLFDPVSGETKVWAVPPAEWGSWLTLVNADNATNLQWQIKTEGVQSYLAAQDATLSYDQYIDSDTALAYIQNLVQSQLNDQPAEISSLRIYHTDRVHTVQAGETLASIAYNYGMPYPWLQQANPGVENLVVGQTLTIPSPDAFLPLPVVENKRIVVSISDQHLWAYENGSLKWDWTISTGISSSPTSPGVFQVQTHEINAYAGNWDLWMPNFMGIYQPIPTSDFMNGFHGFPTRNGSNLLWTNSLGTPVTYGCILVSNDNVALLYDWAEEGVVVEILP